MLRRDFITLLGSAAIARPLSVPAEQGKVAITAGICERRNGVSGSVCGAAILQLECPLWVKSRHRRLSAWCPPYPQKRTSL